MPDAAYQPKVYREQGGARLVVKSGGEVKIESGGKITNDGTQAGAIAAEATADADATYGQPEADLINSIKAKLNLLLAAARGAGFIAP